MAGARRDVLVVEDDPEINGLVGAYAEITGFGYRSAPDGASALDEVRRDPPALIVLDLMLPDLDGFEVCRRVKCEPGNLRIPVIILTALDTEKSRLEGLRCGVVDYLTKPFDPERLMESLSRHGGNGQAKR